MVRFLNPIGRCELEDCSKADNLITERIDGKDYSQGYKTYGFAAPFMSEKQAEQDKAARVQAVH